MKHLCFFKGREGGWLGFAETLASSGAASGGEGGLGIERFTGTASERKGTVENLPEGMECAEDEEGTAGRGASDEDPGRGTDKSPGGTEGPAMFGKMEVELTGPEDWGYSTKLPERSWLYIPPDAAANMECQMEACSTRSSE